MAKRYTDTELYDQEWFLTLPPRLKCAWEWLCKRCDVIGLWHISMTKLSFEVGETVTIDELKTHFKVQLIGDDMLWIPGFVPFQYGDEGGRLSLKNKFHVSIAEKLKANGLPEPIWKPIAMHTECIPNASDRVSDGDGSPQGKGQGQGKGKGNKEERGVGKTSDAQRMENTIRFDYRRILDIFPNPQKKSRALALMAENIGQPETFAELERAVKNYDECCRLEGRELKYILTFPSFFEEWRDWIDWKPDLARPTGPTEMEKLIARIERDKRDRGEGMAEQ
jgi:hypothetical protein